MSDLTPGTGAAERYDVEQVVADARAHDPGLPAETAALLAREAGDHLRALGTVDAPEVARRLLADHPEAGASPAAVVARAACTHFASLGP